MTYRSGDNTTKVKAAKTAKPRKVKKEPLKAQSAKTVTEKNPQTKQREVISKTDLKETEDAKDSKENVSDNSKSKVVDKEVKKEKIKLKVCEGEEKTNVDGKSKKKCSVAKQDTSEAYPRKPLGARRRRNVKKEVKTKDISLMMKEAGKSKSTTSTSLENDNVKSEAVESSDDDKTDHKVKVKAETKKTIPLSPTKKAKKSTHASKKRTTAPANQVKIDSLFEVRRSSRSSEIKKKLTKEKEFHEKLKSQDESHIEISEEGEKGKGIRCTRFLEKGEFVCEYSGELITKKEAEIREEKYGTDPKFGCYMYYFRLNDRVWCVDATLCGRKGRLINHSAKKANVITKSFNIDNKPTLCFFAKTDIAKGVELMYDYGDRRKDALDSHPWLIE